MKYGSTDSILKTSAYYRLTYGMLDGKTRIITNNGELTAPLPKYPNRPTDRSGFQYQRKFDIWLFESACQAARERRDTLGLIRFSQAQSYAKRAKLRFGKPGGTSSEADGRLAEQYLFAAPPPPYRPDPFFTDFTETNHV